MRTERFNNIIEGIVDRSLAMLSKKNDAYSGNADYDEKARAQDDRLRGVKTLAKISGVGAFAALRGVMAKHTMSVYDLIESADSGEIAALPIWQEKISDHINYLLMLEALVHERMDEYMEKSTEENLARGEDPDRHVGQPDDLTALMIPREVKVVSK